MALPPPYYQPPSIPPPHQYNHTHQQRAYAAPSSLPPPIPYDRSQPPPHTPAPTQSSYAPPPGPPPYAPPPGPPPRPYAQTPSGTYAPPAVSSSSSRPSGIAPSQAPRAVTNDDDEDLKRTLEASKRTHAEEQARAQEERDIALAIKLSEEEAARRMRELDDANMHAIFGDFGQDTGGLFDTQVSRQETGPGGFAFPEPQHAPIQPQFTSFDPQTLQAQQEAQQAEYLRQQEEYVRQQQQASQLQAQQEWLRQQEQNASQQQSAQLQAQLLAQQRLLEEQQRKLEEAHHALQEQQALCAMGSDHGRSHPVTPALGSNNPFAPRSRSSSPYPPPGHSIPPLPPSYTDVTSPSPGGTHSRSSSLSANRQSQLSSSPQPVSRPTRADEEHSHLANLYAGKNVGDGVDTFGNVGQLRYGATSAGKLAESQRTTSPFNPFNTQR